MPLYGTITLVAIVSGIVLGASVTLYNLSMENDRISYKSLWLTIAGWTVFNLIYFVQSYFMHLN